VSGRRSRVAAARLAVGSPKDGCGAASARGQATLELLGVLPVVLLLAVAGVQLLAVGYASILAGNAAEAGALALAGGADAQAAVREALPGWSRARARVDVDDGRVAVRLRPPSLVAALEERLEVAAEAAVEDS
jgi:hypothetical protein